jgi:ABC-type uncharacterized transport system auxiliary subunit
VSGLLAGCFSLSQPAPQLRDYRLDYPPPAVAGAPLSATIRVPPLGVTAIYDRLAIVHRADTYSTVPSFYDRWSTNPGSMVADLLARDLADSGVYRAVQQGPSPVPSDYQLTGEIEAIEERATDSGCAADLRLRVLLVRTRTMSNDPVILRATHAETESCPCHEAHALAQAMSRALRRLSERLQQQVYDAIAADAK